jgi:hypothetical protein
MTQVQKRKIGLVLECGPEGADLKVMRHVVTHLEPNAVAEAVTLDNKKKLVAGCGDSTKLLLEGGCERVLIVWDLYPAWREDKARPCRKKDRESVFAALKAAGLAEHEYMILLDGIDKRRVFLVCIEEELEAWLLADTPALEEMLSKPNRSVRVPKFKNPETIQNPKKQLAKLFKTKAGWGYTDHTNAEQIIKKVRDLGKVAKTCPTFARFARLSVGKVW